MKALTTGVNQLVQGEVYALPAFPCQILGSNNYDLSLSSIGPFAFAGFNCATEPGVFSDGGFIRPHVDINLVVKKHTIGSSQSGAATSYSAAVLMDKPSYYWRLNENQGAVAYERMQGLNGTISGGVTINQPGALVDGDKCMVFDGVSGKIVTSGNAIIPATLTVEAWIKTTTTPDNSVFSVRLPPFLVQLVCGFNSLGKLIIWDGLGVSSATQFIINNNQWHHVIYVIDGMTRRFYVDGVFDTATNPGNWTSYTGPVSIGYDEQGTLAANKFFNGAIDEVAIYPYALSQGQITQHYMARSSPFIAGSYASKVIASGPSNYWRLGETYGSSALDVIGGANGTISGGVVLNGEDGMYFDGSGSISAPAVGNLGANITLEFWFRYTLVIAGIHRDVVYAGTTGVPCVGLSEYDDMGQIASYIFNSVASGSDPLPGWGDSKWHHVAIVCNSSTSKLLLYLDGIKRGNDVALPVGTFNITTPTVIGGLGGRRFKGDIDEVAIYPRALSATEILDHYRAR